jgi:hypothetical protein
MTVDDFEKKTERITNIYYIIWGLLFIPGFLFCIGCVVYDFEKIPGILILLWMAAGLIPALMYVGTIGVLYLVQQIKQDEPSQPV